MGVCSEDREKKIYKVTLVGAFCNVILLIFKFLAGVLGNSAAMIADAVHSLSDFITDVVVVVFVKISNRPHDKEHPFGYGKYETLATLIIALFLFGVGGKILIEGALKIWDFCQGVPLERPGYIAVVAAFISVIMKEGLYRYTIKVSKSVNSKVVEANAWHHRSDALSSIGVFVGIGAAALLGDGWNLLDPIAALVVSLFIIKSAIELAIPCIDELMERSLPVEQKNQILFIISTYPDVSEPHNLRTRKIGNYSAVDLHVRMNGDVTLREAHEVATSIEKDIKGYLGEWSVVNIHMEPKKGTK